MTNPHVRDERPGSLRLSFFGTPSAVTRPFGKWVKLAPTKSADNSRRRGYWSVRCVDNSGY